MTYTYLSAEYANADHSAAVAMTQEASAVVVAEAEHPAAWEALHSSGVEIAAFVPPVQHRVFSKRRLFLALTDDEYATFAAIEAQQPARDRRAFAEATELDEADADFPQFLALMHHAYGEERAVEILDAAAF
jgi:ethanolamine utilization microcompartment shell protein EutL